MARKAPAKRTPPADTPTPGAPDRIDALIARLDDWRGERLAEIRRLIREVDPGVVEDWKWMGTPVWSHRGMYALANAHKDKVKITFHHGAQLSDPKGLFNAGLTGNKWRAIDLREHDKLNKTAFKALLREAIRYNQTHEVPKSKGSRGRPASPPRATEGATKPTAKPAPNSAPKPKLLSGGNPQIPKGDGDAPVRAYINAMPGWKRDVGSRLDQLIAQAVPGVRCAVRWNSPFYALDKGWFVSFHCFTRYIKVTFFRGSSLRPTPPVGSKDPDARYFHIHEQDVIDEALFKAWVRQAAKLPGWDGR